MTATAHPRRALALALVAALGAGALVDTAAAQTAAPSFQVIELNYAPAQQTPGLDLRPGRYLLQLQGTSTGGYEGLLRGPRNEIVAERISFSASSGCAAGVPGSAALSTQSLPGRPRLNLLSVQVGNASGGCTLHTVLPSSSLVSPEKPSEYPECEPPVELQLGAAPSGDPGPKCVANAVPDWNPPITSPRPDLKPGRLISLAGRTFRWVESARLTADDASDYRDGRCLFNYAYSVENVGQASSPETDASLLLGSRYGLQFDARTLRGLSPGSIQRIQGQLALPPGTWQVFAHVDSSARVDEWDGQNNARSIVIEVQGNCAAPGSE